MPTVYSVDVNVNLLNSLGSAGGGSPGSGAEGLRDLDRNLGDVQRSSERLLGVWGQLFALQMVSRFGEAGVTAFKGMITNAGNLEESMLNVRLGLNLTGDATRTLQNQFYALDQAHKTSALDMAHTAEIMQESGVRSVSAMTALMEPGGAGGLLDFQDVMKSRSKPIDPDESTRLAMQFIDTATITDPAQQTKMLDLIARALKSDPQASPAGLLNSFQSIHRTAGFAGMSLDNQMQLAAMTTMGGQSGREATQIGALIGALELVGHSPTKQKKRISAQLREQGILDEHGDQTGDIFTMLDKISNLGQSDPKAYKDFIATAFPDQRKQQEVLELTTPEKLNQLKEVQANWAKLATLAEQHNTLMSGVNSQLTVLKSNIQDISSLGGTSLLGATKGIVGQLNQLTGQLKAWQQTPGGQVGSAAIGGALGVGGAALDYGSKVGMAALLLKMLGLGAAAVTTGGVLAAGGAGVGIGVAIAEGFQSIGIWGPFQKGITALIEALGLGITVHGVGEGLDPNRRIEPALHDVPTLDYQSYIFSQHPHRALVRAIGRSHAHGVTSGPTTSGSRTAGSGPRL